MRLSKLYPLLFDLLYWCLHISIRSLEINIYIIHVVCHWNVKFTTVDFRLYHIVAFFSFSTFQINFVGNILSLRIVQLMGVY